MNEVSRVLGLSHRICVPNENNATYLYMIASFVFPLQGSTLKNKSPFDAHGTYVPTLVSMHATHVLA